MASAQEIIPLYTGDIPNSKPSPDREYNDTTQEGIVVVNKVSRPTLTVFLPEKGKANGTAVIICPGGGYHVIAIKHEGYDVAKQFNKMGIAAFVLKYRLPDAATMIDKETGPLQDAQRAIQVVRENAKRWNINKNRVGIMGFSAGGHLAAMAGTHFSKSYISNRENISLRPDFMLLIYPVISFTDSIGHIGSRDALIGQNPSQEKIKDYSNELNVTKNTPPSFLVHAKDDDVVKVQNSLAFASALSAHHVKNEVFLYEKGGHGFGLDNPTINIKWMDKVKTWMRENGWLSK
jgi:acetyl esterase/lipase